MTVMWWLTGAYIILNIVDLIATREAISRGYIEYNPIVLGLVEADSFILIKTLVVIFVVCGFYALHLFYKGYWKPYLGINIFYLCVVSIMIYSLLN